MDQNNQPSQPNQPTPVPTAPIAPGQAPAANPTPTPNVTPSQPAAPTDGQKKNHVMLFVIVGVCVLLISVMIAYIFFFSSKKPVLTQQAPAQVSQQAVASPSPIISQTVQDEVNSVNVNQDNTDIKDVQKDVNAL